MKRQILLATVAIMLASGTASACPGKGKKHSAPPAPVVGGGSAAGGPAVAGGWSATQADSAEVKAAAAYALHMLNRPTATISTIDNASQQVVAGINYRMELTLSDGSRWAVTVWRKLDGSFDMIAATQL